GPRSNSANCPEDLQAQSYPTIRAEAALPRRLTSPVGSGRVLSMKAFLCLGLAFPFALLTTTPGHTDEALSASLLFHASFDQGPDADFAQGDKTLYTAPGRKRDNPVAGLESAKGIEIAKGEGRFGDALAFREAS